MRNCLIAAMTGLFVLGGAGIAQACSDSEYQQARNRLAAYLDQHPNQRNEAFRIWDQLKRGYGNNVPESQRCNVIQQVLAQLESQR